MNLKERFENDFRNLETPKVVTVAIELPNGAIETITNYHDTYEKCKYYLRTYDEDFKLVHNKDVQIVGYMLV